MFFVVMELFFSFRLIILMGLLLSLKLTVSPLEHAICHLLKNWMLQTTVALVIQKPSFPDFLTTRFSQMQRSFPFFGNVKNLKRVFFPFCIVHSIGATTIWALFSLTLFLRAFLHLETLYILSLVFTETGNRKSELCKASITTFKVIYHSCILNI